jgi:hypothetical protein
MPNPQQALTFSPLARMLGKCTLLAPQLKLPNGFKLEISRECRRDDWTAMCRFFCSPVPGGAAVKYDVVVIGAGCAGEGHTPGGY